MTARTFFAPAKLNLFLAVTGRRADGFHDLVSVVAPLDFGDALQCEVKASRSDDAVSLTCDDPAVPVDESNLVVKAARAFAAASGWQGQVRFALEKRIPMGAGLGGGSSDAVAALRALNELTGVSLDPSALQRVAAELGSDCPLFLHGAPAIMRGRGERIAPLPESARERLRGRRVLVFKPGFGIPTPWAYARLAAAAPESYLPAAEAEARLAAWANNPRAPAEELLFNNMEPPAFTKFVALPTMLELLRKEFGLQPRMSGSGSACFCFLGADSPVPAIGAAIRRGWGETAFLAEARVA